MPNAAAQLVVDPLFRRGVLFFRGGVRRDVLRHFFSPKDFFRERKLEGVNMRLQMRARNGFERKLTLEWYTSLVECCPP
jgi:hypothetical protein